MPEFYSLELRLCASSHLVTTSIGHDLQEVTVLELAVTAGLAQFAAGVAILCLRFSAASVSSFFVHAIGLPPRRAAKKSHENSKPRGHLEFCRYETCNE